MPQPPHVADAAPGRPFLTGYDMAHLVTYSAVMTPVIIVIMDARQPFGAGVLIDRLVATLIGAGLVIGANLIFSKIVAAPTPDRSARA